MQQKVIKKYFGTINGSFSGFTNKNARRVLCIDKIFYTKLTILWGNINVEYSIHPGLKLSSTFIKRQIRRDSWICKRTKSKVSPYSSPIKGYRRCTLLRSSSRSQRVL